MDGKARDNDEKRTEGPRTVAGTPRPFTVTHRKVLAIAVPMTLAFLTTPLQGLVDTGVVGQLGVATAIGGLAVGAVILDVLYNTFNFLRTATTGLVAQAIGRGDAGEEQAVFWRSLAIALVCGAVMVLASPLVIAIGGWAMDPGAGVFEAMATYVSIRLLSAPAGLANYAILGALLGRGRSAAALALQILINGLNIVVSLWFGLHLGWGITGVAFGTVVGEVAGTVCGFACVVAGFERASRPSLAEVADRRAIGRLMGLNRDIMIRSFALLGAFAFFTRTGAQFGATTLAANAILLNIFFIAGNYLDGFATAAEQMVGRAIGANYRPAFDRAIRLATLWGFALAACTAVVFLVFGGPVIRLMTTAPEVRAAAIAYLPWAALTPIAGVLAFEMDGVFVGATWSRDMRNMMLVSLGLFLAATLVSVPVLGNHGLWLFFNVFLGLRGLTLTALVRRRAAAAFPTA
ncbi:MATE family efflux transporter [Pararhizobium mangrovi]|uniref:MATE family efflux transporter n=1 Tax=Pararhizobium mangrovi TaxID=2590452 RepID=A0A506TYL0_9HYPH|nr:MATE family efflux transporter [Pararhizobium mangrovi]TPW25805.1 MATE family efflux transporter [Pararhizobium mangrovi]